MFSRFIYVALISSLTACGSSGGDDKGDNDNGDVTLQINQFYSRQNVKETTSYRFTPKSNSVYTLYMYNEADSKFSYSSVEGTNIYGGCSLYPNTYPGYKKCPMYSDEDRTLGLDTSVTYRIYVYADPEKAQTLNMALVEGNGSGEGSITSPVDLNLDDTHIGIIGQVGSEGISYFRFTTSNDLRDYAVQIANVFPSVDLEATLYAQADFSDEISADMLETDTQYYIKVVNPSTDPFVRKYELSISSSEISASVLEGSWKVCIQGDANAYFGETETFSGTNMSFHSAEYSDSECTKEIAGTAENGELTFTIGSDITTEGGLTATAIDWNDGSENAYGIFLIDENVLYFGDPNTGAGDTPQTRPIDLDVDTYIYNKQ